MQRIILILEDNTDRIVNFKTAARTLGPDFRLQIWNDAPRMIRESSRFFAETCLISLDHDLERQPGATEEPGTGFDAARYLLGQLPICPVILHSGNQFCREAMRDELRASRWNAHAVAPFGNDWIFYSWLPTVLRLIGA